VLHFKFKDHDPMGPDDNIEEAYVGLDQYVDSREHLQIGLSKGGVLTMRQTEPLSVFLSVRLVSIYIQLNLITIHIH